MRVALVGIGGMGEVHFNAYKNIKNAELVAVCDVRKDVLEKKTADCDVKLYDDIDELLKNEQLDVIDICTPSYMHMEHVLKALDCGINVLCEKPMAMNSEQTKLIMDKVNETGKKFMVAHVVRFMNNYKYLKDVIDSEKYGKLLRLDMKRISSAPRWSWDNWMMSKEKSGLTPLDLMIHDVDFMQYLFGMPNDICGVRYNLSNYNDYAAVTYLYDDFSVSTEATWYNTKIPFMAEYLAVFEDGYVQLRNNEITECGEKVVLKTEYSNVDTGINLDSADGYDGEIEYFIDCVSKGIQPNVVTPQSSADSIKLIEMTEEKLITVGMV